MLLCLLLKFILNISDLKNYDLKICILLIANKIFWINFSVY